MCARPVPITWSMDGKTCAPAQSAGCARGAPDGRGRSGSEGYGSLDRYLPNTPCCLYYYNLSKYITQTGRHASSRIASAGTMPGTFAASPLDITLFLTRFFRSLLLFQTQEERKRGEKYFSRKKVLERYWISMRIDVDFPHSS